MLMRLQLAVVLGSLAVLVVGSPVGAAVVPEAGEFLVSRTPDSSQENPVAAFAPGGGSLVVWEDSHHGVRARRYTPAGDPVGRAVELAVNTVPATIPGAGDVVFAREPSVAYLPGGDFLVAWAEESGYVRVEPFFQDFRLDERRVMARRFRASGRAAGPAFEVSAGGTGEESWPKLQVVPGGGVLAVWRSDDPATSGGPADGLFARLLDRAGRPQGAQVRLSPVGDDEAQYAALAEGAGGQILVAWEGCCDAGGDLGVFARVFDAAAGSFGPVVQLNGDTAGRQRRPAVAAAGESGFFVLWQSELERSLIPIFGRLFDLAGRPVAAEHQVSHGFDTVQLAPGLAARPGGGYVAVWRDWYGPFFGISAVELDAAGRPLGEHFRLNDGRVHKSGRTSIATDGAGRFLVPWEKVVKGRQGIGARRLESGTPARSGRSVGLGVVQ